MTLRTVDEQLSSPFHEVRDLVEHYRNGDFDTEDFLTELDGYEERLQVLYEGVAAEPGGTGVEEDLEVLEDAVAGIHLFSDVSERLREFAENGEEEAATEALEMAQQAHHRWVELVELRGDLLSKIAHSSAQQSYGDSSEEYWG